MAIKQKYRKPFDNSLPFNNKTPLLRKAEIIYESIYNQNTTNNGQGILNFKFYKLNLYMDFDYSISSELSLFRSQGAKFRERTLSYEKAKYHTPKSLKKIFDNLETEAELKFPDATTGTP